MLENHELTLIVDGRQFGGWLDVRMSRGIERAAGDFQIGVTQRWLGLDARFEIPKGASCEVRIGHWIKFTNDPKPNTIVARARRLELRVGEKYLILDADHGLVSGLDLRRLHSS